MLQGAVRHSELAGELGHVAELDKLLTNVNEGRLSCRNRALAVLARERGIGQTYVCSFLYLAKKTATKYWKDYKSGGTAALFARKPNGRQKSTDARITEAVFALLHSPPSVHRGQPIDLEAHRSSDNPALPRRVSISRCNTSHHKGGFTRSRLVTLSFITGRMPIRSALSVVVAPGDPNYLHAETPTIAEFYKKNGYTTYMSGKWHLGDTPAAFPSAHGFDYVRNFLAYYAGAYCYDDVNLHSFFDHPKFVDMYKKVVKCRKGH